MNYTTITLVVSLLVSGMVGYAAELIGELDGFCCPANELVEEVSRIIDPKVRYEEWMRLIAQQERIVASHEREDPEGPIEDKEKAVEYVVPRSREVFTAKRRMKRRSGVPGAAQNMPLQAMEDK